jgi:hypothetical protein
MKWFVISVLGFGNVMSATWDMFTIMHGFAKRLLGMSVLLLGNGLVSLSKAGYLARMDRDI